MAAKGRPMNNRRKLLVALGSAALASPFASFAQQPGKVWRVGFLSQRQIAISESDNYYGPFRKGMRELGYVDGKNLIIEWRSADGNSERLPGLAMELVNLKVDVIVTAGTPATSAAKKSTTIIPIVIGNAGDPVRTGLVQSLARPGGNITGVTNMSGDVMPKQLEMLLAMAPKVSRVAVLVNPANPSNIRTLEAFQSALPKRGVTVQLQRMQARTSEEIEDAFSSMRQHNVGAVIVSLDPFFQQQKSQIASLAVKFRLPSISSSSEAAEVGSLMSYGPSFAEQFRRAAIYVDKIFKGAKPADLPIEQPTKFELVINGRIAKALGLKIPQSLLVMADMVIE
jgi:putative ABC transport system substrate-binding protein